MLESIIILALRSRGILVQIQALLYTKFEASLSYMNLPQKQWDWRDCQQLEFILLFQGTEFDSQNPQIAWLLPVTPAPRDLMSSSAHQGRNSLIY